MVDIFVLLPSSTRVSRLVYMNAVLCIVQGILYIVVVLLVVGM